MFPDRHPFLLDHHLFALLKYIQSPIDKGGLLIINLPLQWHTTVTKMVQPLHSMNKLPLYTAKYQAILAGYGLTRNVCLIVRGT